jgi:hypothetical protein
MLTLLSPFGHLLSALSQQSTGMISQHSTTCTKCSSHHFPFPLSKIQINQVTLLPSQTDMHAVLDSHILSYEIRHTCIQVWSSENFFHKSKYDAQL